MTKTKFLLASTQHGGANGRRSRGQTQAGRGGEWWAQVVTGGPAGKGTLTETSGPLTVFVTAQAQGWTCAWRGRLARGEQPLGWGCRAHTVAFTFPLSEKAAMAGGGRWPGGGGLSYVCGLAAAAGLGTGSRAPGLDATSRQPPAWVWGHLFKGSGCGGGEGSLAGDLFLRGCDGIGLCVDVGCETERGGM